MALDRKSGRLDEILAPASSNSSELVADDPLAE
jgi:hypothetical protein